MSRPAGRPVGRPASRPPARGRTVVMRRGDAALLLGALAALTLWLSLTDGMMRYVRPSMRPWLVASGVFVGLLAVAAGVTARRSGGPASGGHGHRGPWLVGWLVALPVVVAVAVAPGALGAYTVRQSSWGVPAIDFDLDHHLRTRTFGGQTPELQLHELLVAANGEASDQRLLARTEVRLTGFVVAPDGGSDSGAEGRFLLGRLMIGCCAGDAIGLAVDVRGYDGPALDDETWVEVTGRYDRSATAAARRSGADTSAGPTGPNGSGTAPPIVRATSVRVTDAPDRPYETPR